MAKASQQLNNIKIKLRIATREAIKKAAKEMAVYIVDIIKLRTRIEGEGLKGKLPALTSEAYKKLRAKSKNLSSETSPNESNLTATGQLIDALKSKVTGSKISITINNNKRKKELNGSKSGYTNNEIRKFVEDNGREFLGLTAAENKEALDLTTQIIETEIRNALRNT
jgi:hypothetical protein